MFFVIKKLMEKLFWVPPLPFYCTDGQMECTADSILKATLQIILPYFGVILLCHYRKAIHLKSIRHVFPRNKAATSDSGPFGTDERSRIYRFIQKLDLVRRSLPEIGWQLPGRWFNEFFDKNKALHVHCALCSDAFVPFCLFLHIYRRPILCIYCS